MDSFEARCITEEQRLCRYFYSVALKGHDPLGPHESKAELQRYAAKRSKATRARLFALIDAANAKTEEAA